jgi:DeoR/GlpR family transcriptional regulator of sugar metabolism
MFVHKGKTRKNSLTRIEALETLATMKSKQTIAPSRLEEVLKVANDIHPGNKEAGDEYIFRKQQQQHMQKQLLAEYIVKKYVKDLDAVAIDAGSTQQLIVEKMMDTRSFLSILTNNMTAFMRNSRHRIDKSANEFILTGGKYVALFDALLGNETAASFTLFHPTVVIIGVSGLVPGKGFFCHGNDEVNIKKLLFQKKDSTILIPADYSKLGRSDSYLFGDTKEFRNRDATTCVVVTAPPPLVPTENGSDPKHESDYSESKCQYEKHKKNLENEGVIVVEAEHK